MKKMKKGFTLIELMIVIAIIAIIAAIAIPNLMQSRIRANEATAISALKGYCTAQVTFQVGRQGRAAVNKASGKSGYCMVYPNLFYGHPATRGTSVDNTTNLALISKAHADAFITGPVAVADINYTGGGALTTTPYQGYEFANPSEADAGAAAYFATKFGQIAAPTTAGSTGNNMYWVGVEGTVYSLGLFKGDTPTVAVTNTTPDSDYANWLSL